MPMWSLLVLLSLPLLALPHRLLYEVRSSLDEGCQFVLAEHQFNLCPIISNESRLGQLQVQRVDNNSSLAVVYTFGFIDRSTSPGLSYQPAPSQLQCPQGTWICMTTIDHRTSIMRAIPIASTPLPGMETAGHIIIKLDDTPNAPVTLRLRGESQGPQVQQALIQLHCDEIAVEPSAPAFLWEAHGVHSFIWKSRHGCPITSRSVTSADVSAPPEDKKDKGEQELLDPTAKAPMKRRLLFVLLLPGAALIMIGFAIYNPTAVTLRYWYDTYTKPPRFRVGEISLVQWTDEEGALEGEEDEMVNAMEHPDHHREYIPLKPSPRRNIQTYYGSIRHGDRHNVV